MKKLLLILAALIAAAGTAAADGKCQVIHYKADQVYEIKAALYKGTHIQLPERLMFPPQGGSDLWTIEGDGHHVMVQPNSGEPQGERTSMTLITQSNTAYHFNIRRVSFSDAATCVIIEKKGKYFENAAMAGPGAMTGSGYQTPDERTQLALQQQLTDMQAALQAERQLSDERINGVIAKYRSMIYTRYQWSEGMGFMGENLVTDVWDDGRFTYIRVTPENRGLLAAKAEIDGHQEMIEYQADSDHVYKISGIYPKFCLVYGENNQVTVTRRDNQSNGVY